MTTDARTAEQKTGPRLGKILFSRVLLFSLVLTLLFTVIQATLSYRAQVGEVHRSMDDIQNAHLKGIIAALWNFDQKVLAAQLNGILDMRYINYVAVIENDAVVIEEGERKKGGVITREIPLSISYRGSEVPLGRLSIQADTTRVASDVAGRIAATFLFSLTTVAITAFFLLMLFNRLVTRHLYSLATYFGGITDDPDRISAQLRLDKAQRNDELDILVDSFNNMRADLASSCSQLRQSRDSFSALYNHTPVMMHSINAESAIVEVNNHWLKTLGYERDEVLGKKITEFLAEASRKDARDVILPAFFRDGFVKDIPYQFVKKHGELVEVLLSATGERDATGNVVRSQAVIADITERKRSEEERIRLENQLRQAQKMEAVGQLAGGVAHDFNNILSAIIGYSTLALMKIGADDPNRHNIEQILASSERATVLTQSLLAFSRKQVVNLTRIDLNGVVSQFKKFLLRLLREDIELTTTLDDQELPVIADRGQIEQVLMNLVTNSRDAMPAGGWIVIKTSLVEIDDAFARAHDLEHPGEYALLSVIDTGIGIPEDIRNRVFEPFFTTKEQGKGTGLGLSMVYGLVRQHKGCIVIHSMPGSGTTFTLYLPVSRAAAHAEERMAEETSPLRGGTETVLLAEDDAAMRKVAATVLRHYGYTVIEALDGQDAVDKFMENRDKVGIVVLDGIMPRMNGKEAWRRIKALDPGIKAMFVSGYAEDIFTKDGVPDGEAAFVLKPVSPPVLVRRVREVLDE